MTRTGDGAPDTRREELSRSLRAVTDRVELACRDAGRPPGSVALLAVTKTFPAGDVRLLAELGVTAVGENRVQEAAAKHAELADVAVRWHLVGGVQRNKARTLLDWCDRVESVDRLPLVEALSAAAMRAGRELEVLVQVSLDPVGDAQQQGAGRSGVTPDRAAELAEHVAQAPGLTLRGVMAVATLGGDPDADFARLAAVAARVCHDHPGADEVSAGMSGDLEAAVRHGSTSVRVGRALLGFRPQVVG